MNPLLLGINLWSFRRELKYIGFVFLLVLLLPLFSILVITHAGFELISDALVQVDAETRTIQLINPADGSIIREISPRVAWPVLGVITLEFGESSLYQPFHTGIDIANRQGRVGDPITPAMDGRVVTAREISWGYGKHVIIDHGDNITTVYAHLNRINVVVNDEVEIGDVIGTMGNTGWSTGPHLHFEVRVYGIPVNPRVFL